MDLHCKFDHFEHFVVDCKLSLFSKAYMHFLEINLESVVGPPLKRVYIET